MRRSTSAGDVDLAVLYTREQSLALAQEIERDMTADDELVRIVSRAKCETRFALSDVQGGSAAFLHVFGLHERIRDRLSDGGVNQVEQASLKAAVERLEALMNALTVGGPPAEPSDPLRPPGTVNEKLWSDSSLALITPEQRLAAIETALNAAQHAGVVAAGSVVVTPRTQAILTKAGHYEYGRTSSCGYSIVARTSDNTGSGWAGWEGEDWPSANVGELAARAVDLAQRSQNPVAVEPGRYTVVMTPEACGDIVGIIALPFFHVLEGPMADAGVTPFSKPGGGNKIGLKVLDERVSFSTDPMDPECGFIPFDSRDLRVIQFTPATWVDRGILKTLSYPTRAEATAHGIEQVNNSGAMRMSGGPTSIEEMIATTERGILVTRFSDIAIVSFKTLYLTGVTRNGTFLIEKGKVTKPVKNMRFEDSPFFFLNNLEAIGPARRVPGNLVMPPIKVRDFAFTSLTDSI